MADPLFDIQNSFPKLTGSNHDIALTIGDGSITYACLNERIESFASGLVTEQEDLSEERIAFLIPGSLDYVTTLLGIWKAGGIAVPLSVSSAIPELQHALSSAAVTRIIVGKEYREKLRELCQTLAITMTSTEDVINVHSARHLSSSFPLLDAGRRAMILFTSGTTNKPKGVVTTHGNICAQITTLVDAWEWQKSDTIPLFLPLHHVHGIINVLCCALWAGACVDIYPSFNMDKIVENIIARKYSVFMAVPTVYSKLIQYIGSVPAERQDAICAGFNAMRLNISGSAACPIPIFEKWKKLTQQTLLERYGMTEIGMAISNPYRGERRAGAVGLPLPGVEVALFDEANEIITNEDISGEIRVRGSSVFLEYWNNIQATNETFNEGWFCTGDVGILEAGYYRIMGRSSIDIIKSGGYKLSALEIEGVLLNHEDIDECAVIGVADETWGESVTAFLVLRPNTQLSIEGLKSWSKDKMSTYKIPKEIKVVDSLPRNAMGKVTKKELKKWL
ncbi:MAG: malonyl-CoA/methylmalonyl-CoA synthetase [Oceanicoccus sp.]|jgi:malonyl-CoA/methylmalonyl-CoA synthetase